MEKTNITYDEMRTLSKAYAELGIQKREIIEFLEEQRDNCFAGGFTKLARAMGKSTEWGKVIRSECLLLEKMGIINMVCAATKFKTCPKCIILSQTWTERLAYWYNNEVTELWNLSRPEALEKINIRKRMGIKKWAS